MNLPLFIAGRYLFAKKSHNVINIISAISVAGMAVGTAALILILSVYNGFDGIIRSNLSDLDPDLLVCDGEGRKHFEATAPLLDSIRAVPGVAGVSEVLEDNVYISYGSTDGIAWAKGVDSLYEHSTALSEHLVEGRWSLHLGEIPQACIGNTLAYKYSIHPRFVEQLKLHYPDRRAKVSVSNPSNALHTVKVAPSGLFSISTDIDSKTIILPLETMRELLKSNGREVSGIEVRFCDGDRAQHKRTRAAVESLLGSRYRALTREQQHTDLYKMMRYEKAAVFLILIFVVLIVAFNIFGSLSMLIIEKEPDIATLSAMGAERRSIRKVFVYEGWLISLLGLAIGLVCGVVLALLQQHFGLVKMPGNYLIESYPVVLQASDVLLSAVGVALIGLLIALLSTTKLKK